MKSLHEQLIDSVTRGNVAEVRQLITRGASPNSHDIDSGWSALCVALSRKQAEAAEHLIELGANVNEVCSYRTVVDRSVVEGTVTPLGLASQMGDERLVRRLLAAGAHANAVDALDGSTPLHHAVTASSAGAVGALLEGGADANLVNGNKESPLTLAVRKGDAHLVQRLLDAGAKPEADALRAAVARGETELAELLVRLASPLAATVRDPSLLESAIPAGLPAVQWLLNRPEGRELLERDGFAAVRTAAHLGATEVLRYLLDLGVPFEAHDRMGWTPLISAAWSGHTEAVRLLLGAGADPLRPDLTGKTAAEWARQAGHHAIAALLSPADGGGRSRTRT